MNFDYFLFDLDNTLIQIPNPKEYFDIVLVKALKEILVKPIPSRKIRNQFWVSGLDYQYLLSEWGGKAVHKFWYYFDLFDFEARKALISEKKLRLYDDVMESLQVLRNSNKMIALVSNAAECIVSYILREYKIEGYFDEVFALGDNKPEALAKPSPLGIKIVLKNLMFNPHTSKALMVGDSTADIYAAKRAGINACLIIRDIDRYHGGYKDWHYQPDIIIEQLYELLDL